MTKKLNHRRRAIARRRMPRRLQLAANAMFFAVAYRWSFSAMLLAKRWNY